VYRAALYAACRAVRVGTVPVSVTTPSSMATSMSSAL
jgi:hypothetical protein